MADAESDELLRQRRFTPTCAIGASAGGVAALQTLFRLLPSDLGLAYVVILHLAPDQPSAMEQILGACTRMPVHQVQDGQTLAPNCVYVIAPDRELVIDGNNVSARDFTEPRGKRAPIDLFFRSIAAGRGDGISVILTGAGSDGSLGIRAVAEAGGVVMVQEPADAAFPMMPQSAIATGAVDFVGTLPRLAERIAEVAQSKEAVRSLDADGAANELRRIVGFLRACTGHDFSSYKRATVLRRVMRRMQVTRTDKLADYAEMLRATPEEAQALFADLLISVTTFFRDQAAFRVLEHRAIAPIFERADPDEGIRVWIVGSATGEEAYSIAMLLLEEAGRRKVALPMQIFASDLDEGALATAREGRYPRTIDADVTDERLERFFVDEGSHYRIRKQVRDMVLFASHSVIKDPPFTRLDLISCRNLLIYLERSLQQQVGAIFHYGLRPEGYLFLGSAETADGSGDLFISLDREARLYQGRLTATQPLPPVSHLHPVDRLGPSHHPPAPMRSEPNPHLAIAHVAALEHAAPPSVLVDQESTILNMSPSAGRFVLHSGGPISNSLPAIVRPELRLDLKLALARALGSVPMLTHPITVQFESERRRVSLYVQPVGPPDRGDPRALVLFLDGGPETDVGTAEEEEQTDELRRVHGELKAAHEALVVSRHEHNASVQDLRAVNEELQSINEEYRSTAEELETSKEELQSMNEELLTVNAELKIKLEGISVAHGDLRNITDSTEIGTLFLDDELRIRLFTASVTDLVNITAHDVGRRITDFTHRLEHDDIEQDVGRVLRTLKPVDREVRSRDGRWYVMRIRPYRTVEDRISGAVISFIDVSSRHEAEARLAQSERQLRALIEVSFEVIYSMDPDWSRMRELMGGGFLSDTRSPNEKWIDHYIPVEDQARVRGVIDQAIETRSIFDLEHQVRRSDGSIGWTHSRAVPLIDADTGEITEWFGSAVDITTRRRAEAALIASERRYRALIEGAPQLVWTAGDGGELTWSSSQWHAYTGQTDRESRGRGWLNAVHPDDRVNALAAWEAAAETGLYEAEYRVGSKATGAHRWFRSRAMAVDDSTGQRNEWLGTSTDVDDYRVLQERQELLLTELQHRVRNTLTVIRSVFSRTAGAGGTLEDVASHFQGRLDSLARTQVVVTRSPGGMVALEDLIREELLSVGVGDGPAVTIDGPEVALSPSKAQLVGLAIHELTTNALKYGALKAPGARLAVHWTANADYDGDQQLKLIWTEQGVPAVSLRPVHQGFGTELLTEALPYQLGAETSLEFLNGGVRCTISIPLLPDDTDSMTDERTSG